MRIVLQRVYEQEQQAGYRVLADRIWPRGITKEQAALDEWCKDIAPSTGLRKWFRHDPARWEAFREKYRQELEHDRDAAEALLKRTGKNRLVLLYGAKDKEHAHVLVLKDYLESLS